MQTDSPTGAVLSTYQPLYLKYRPQSLGDLVGQGSVARTLANAIEHNRISHAYLFTGPRGTGKTSSARILAKSLNCQKGPTAEPCLVCDSCLEIKSGVSPSVIEIDAASNNSVDDARQLIERAPLVAQGGRFKLYIIDECHMLTKEAFNALLKTIEEPPPKVVFILATTEEHKVPATIVSRCQRLMFRLVNQRDLCEHLRKISELEQIFIDDEALDVVTRRSGGGLRDALGLLDQASLLSQPEKPVTVQDLLTLLGAVNEDILLEISQAVQRRDGQAVLKAIAALLAEGREPAVLVVELAKHAVNLLKASYAAAGGSVSIDELKALSLGSQDYIRGLVEQAPGFDRAELAQMVEFFDRLEQTCRRSSQPTLHLEMGLISLCHRHDILLVRELEERLRKVEAELSEDATHVRLPSASQAPPPSVRTQSARPQSGYAGNYPQPAPAEPHRAAASAPMQAPAYSQQQAPAASVRSGESFQAVESRTGAGAATDSNVNAGLTAADLSKTSPAASDVARHRASASGSDSDSASDMTGSQSPEPEHRCDSPQSPAPSSASGEEPSSHSTSQEQSPGSLPRAAGSLLAVEEFWSDLLDELQRRHLPTFSLVSTHGFPLTFDDDGLVVGVKENFQKTLENKVEHIKSAGAAILGRPITVRVKVVNQPQPAARPKGRGKDDKPARVRGADDSEEPEGGRLSSPSGMAESQAQAAGGVATAPRRTDVRPEAGAVQVGREAAKPSKEGDTDSTLIQEAYRLFEGPGSRRIE